MRRTQRLSLLLLVAAVVALLVAVGPGIVAGNDLLLGGPAVSVSAGSGGTDVFTPIGVDLADADRRNTSLVYSITTGNGAQCTLLSWELFYIGRFFFFFFASALRVFGHLWGGEDLRHPTPHSRLSLADSTFPLHLAPF